MSLLQERSQDGFRLLRFFPGTPSAAFITSIFSALIISTDKFNSTWKHNLVFYPFIVHIITTSTRFFILLIESIEC